MLRFVQPETARLTLGNGTVLIVKKRLSAGEYRTMLRRMSYRGSDDTLKLDHLETGIARMLAYLVDWNVPEVVIRDKPASEIEAALNMLDPDDFEQVKDAIVAHEIAMLAEREEEKKLRSGDPLSPSISRSLVAVGGGTNG